MVRGVLELLGDPGPKGAVGVLLTEGVALGRVVLPVVQTIVKVGALK